MSEPQDQAMADRAASPVTAPPATSAQAASPQATLNDHRRTYDRMIGMFKWLIIAVAFILLGLLVFLR